MKPNPKKARQREQTLQVWTLTQAKAASAYIASIVRSLREHTLEALTLRRNIDRLDQLPGRPSRRTLIAIQEATREMHQAEDRYQEAAEELEILDVFCIDPLRGQAVVPFVHDDQLAWYLFDLFDSQPLRFWRYQTDPEETRRPVTPKQHGMTGTTSAL